MKNNQTLMLLGAAGFAYWWFKIRKPAVVVTAGQAIAPAGTAVAGIPYGMHGIPYGMHGIPYGMGCSAPTQQLGVMPYYMGY